MTKRIIIILSLTIIFVSCNNHENSFTETDCPYEICTRAFKFAELYKETGIPYELGGQSPIHSAGKIGRAHV